MKKTTVGLIGAGNMGQAIIKGLSADKKYQVIFAEKDAEKAVQITKKHKIKKNNLKQLTNDANIIIICVKPQVIDEVLCELKGRLEAGQLVVSIAAGVTLEKIEKMLGKGTAVIRVMPNMPAMIGQGISAYCCGRWVSKSQEKAAETIFASVGEVVKVKSTQMDAVTAVTGSGPGFIAYLADGLIEAAIKSGFDRQTAEKLVIKTLKGTADLMDKTAVLPAELVEKVASRGGTTEAGLKVLAADKTKNVLVKTIKQAMRRSKELSK